MTDEQDKVVERGSLAVKNAAVAFKCEQMIVTVHEDEGHKWAAAAAYAALRPGNVLPGGKNMVVPVDMVHTAACVTESGLTMRSNPANHELFLAELCGHLTNIDPEQKLCKPSPWPPNALQTIRDNIADYIGDLLVVADGEMGEPVAQQEQARDTLKVLNAWLKQLDAMLAAAQGGSQEETNG